jgi:hypothetical protein
MLIMILYSLFKLKMFSTVIVVYVKY